MRIYFLALAVSQEGKMILRRVVKNKAVYFTARLTLREKRGVSPLGPDVKILTNQNFTIKRLILHISPKNLRSKWS